LLTDEALRDDFLSADGFLALLNLSLASDEIVRGQRGLMDDCHRVNARVLMLELAVLTNVQILASEAQVARSQKWACLAVVARNTMVLRLVNRL